MPERNNKVDEGKLSNCTDSEYLKWLLKTCDEELQIKHNVPLNNPKNLKEMIGCTKGEQLKKDDILYGLEDSDYLETSVVDVIRREIEETCDLLDSNALEQIEWPIKVLEYKRMNIGGEARAKDIAMTAIDHALDDLNDDFGNIESDEEPMPTESMWTAALAFGRAVVADYVSWACEPTGKIIHYTREDAERESFI